MRPSLVYRFTLHDGLLLKSSLHFQISPDFILRGNLQHMPPIEQQRVYEWKHLKQKSNSGAVSGRIM